MTHIAFLEQFSSLLRKDIRFLFGTSFTFYLGSVSCLTAWDARLRRACLCRVPTDTGEELEDLPESPRSHYEHMVELGWQRAERLALGFVAPGPAGSQQAWPGSERARGDDAQEDKAPDSPGTRHDRVCSPVWGPATTCARSQLSPRVLVLEGLMSHLCGPNCTALSHQGEVARLADLTCKLASCVLCVVCVQA